MAVKHKVVDIEERPGATPDYMFKILRLLEKYRNDPDSIPQGQDLFRLCEFIVQKLGAFEIPREASAISSFNKDVLDIQEFLKTVCVSEKTILVILKELYSAISQPNCKPGAAMSVVLQLVDSSRLPAVVNLILELEASHSDSSLEQALSTLCSWLEHWIKTPNLGECILVFMQGLELRKRYDILINVSLNYVEKYFMRLKLSAYRPFVGPIVMYMLTHMQASPEAFHKILPHVHQVTTCLRQDTSELAPVYLQEVVNVCKALSERFPGFENMILEPIYKKTPPSANYRTYLDYTPWSDEENQYIVQRLENDKVGLNNLGNTCYMNSVLQALFMTKLFSNNVLTQEHRGPLISKLQALFAMLQFSQCRSLSPSDILHLARPPGFHPGQQHDSSEFLGYLLDILHEEENSGLASALRQDAMEASPITEMKQLQSGDSPLPAGDSPPLTMVQRAFGGRAETIYKCHACGAESRRADNFRDLQLSFPSDFIEGDSVQTLLDYYLKPERLCGDNQYYCERCNGLADAERVFRVVQSPRRLVLTLKHFHYNAASHQRIKLLHTVQYNPVLKLANAVYEVCAAVIHCGTSVDSGHYYTYARDREHGWFKFNDNYVSQCSNSDLSNLKPPETPYILFYSREDCTEPAAINRMQLPHSVESALKHKISEEEDQERNNRQRLVTNIITKKDDPPPPGCGGGSTFTANDRYVC